MRWDGLKGPINLKEKEEKYLKRKHYWTQVKPIGFKCDLKY